VFYIPFPNSHAGTTYTVHKVSDGPGVVDDSTEIIVNYHDSHLPEGAFDVTFEDIGGLGKQIKLIRELVQLPLKDPHVYRHLGINPPRGIILYGPPGSGKTHLARAVANEVDARFYYINGPDVIGTYTGETEANLRRMFNEAGHHSPSVIFIDELDAMAPKRGETGAHADTRAVTQLLSLMDGLKRVDSVIVIGTTNRIDAVDPAFRRPGRFDREIFIGPPDAGGRREILEIHSREMPLSDPAQEFLDEVARRTHGFLGADLMELCRDAGLNALRRSRGDFDHRAAYRIPLEKLRIEREDFELALSQTRPSALRETLISIPDVSWRDIGGLDAVKERLQETVDLPLRNPQLLTASGLPPHVGALLYGPPGTGKTLLAKALANECGVNFISVDGPEIFTKWLGESEEGVRQVFRIARQVAPAVIFFDQLESITPVRGQHAGSMTTDRVVSQLLAELDGVEQLSRVIVLGATNRIDLIDPSILRPGRFGVHIPVGLPDLAARKDILRICLRTSAGRDGGEIEAIVEAVAPLTENFSGARLKQLSDDAKRAAIKRTGFSEVAAPTVADLLAALERAKREDAEAAKR
jgi:transitional endoplasmic reticulum ATPase